MLKRVTIITIICLSLIFSLKAVSDAQLTISPADQLQLMKEHIEKVKIKNPQKYQKMVERAGNNITDCCSCHTEVYEGSISPCQMLMDKNKPVKK
jgi:hypothetical protein